MRPPLLALAPPLKPARLQILLLVALATAGCTESGQTANPGGQGGGAGQAGTNATASGAGGQAAAGAGGQGTGGQVAQAGAGGTAAGSGGQSTAGDGGSAGTTAGGNGGGPPQTTLGPAGFTCPAGPFAAPLEGDMEATLVRGDLGGELEGPAWLDSQQALYFTQSGGGNANGQINKYTPQDDMLDVFVSSIGVGGLAVDTEGKLLAASYDKRSITRFDPVTMERSDVPGGDSYDGNPLNEVNDLVMRSDGNIYFSDPQYDSVPPGEEPMAFYRLSPAPESTVTLVLLADGSNGVALSPDGAFLYLGTTESGGGPVRRQALNPDGSVNGSPTSWNEGSSDGMAMDCAGNLYISTDGQIRVLSPNDEVLGNITGLLSGGGYVTNSAFGDADHQTLYITTNTSLFKVHLGVPGFPN